MCIYICISLLCIDACRVWPAQAALCDHLYVLSLVSFRDKYLSYRTVTRSNSNSSAFLSRSFRPPRQSALHRAVDCLERISLLGLAGPMCQDAETCMGASRPSPPSFRNLVGLTRTWTRKETPTPRVAQSHTSRKSGAWPGYVECRTAPCQTKSSSHEVRAAPAHLQSFPKSAECRRRCSCYESSLGFYAALAPRHVLQNC